LYCSLENASHPFVSLANELEALQERLNILSRHTKTVAQLTIVDKKATVGEPGGRVDLVLPYRFQA